MKFKKVFCLVNKIINEDPKIGIKVKKEGLKKSSSKKKLPKIIPNPKTGNNNETILVYLIFF